MIPRTLVLHFLTLYLKVTGWFLLGVASIIFLVDFNENSGRVSGIAGVKLIQVLWLTAMRIPFLLQQTIPFVVLFSSMIALVTLNRKQELVVTRAAGISVWQFMFPFVAGAFLVGMLAVMVLNPLAAFGMRAAIGLESTMHATGASDSSHVPWLHQITKDDNVIIGARSVAENGTLLSGVVMFHFDPHDNVVLRQDAATAKLEHGYWELNDVTETRPGEAPKHLKSTQMRTSLKQEFVQERLAQPETIGFFDLSKKIATAKSFGISAAPLQTQYHSLLSLPLLMMAMTLIAGTVTLRFSRMSQSPVLILGGILSGFMLYVVTMLAKAFGSSGVVPPFVAAWIPAIVAMSIGATVLLHQEDG